MQKKDNIIVLQSKKPFKSKNNSAEFQNFWKSHRALFEKKGIEVLVKRKLFKNCLLVDIDSGHIDPVDILVEGNLIQKIAKNGSFADVEEKCEVFDVEFNFVLPPFFNCFCDSVKAIETNFEGQLEDTSLAENIIAIKNILAGAVFVWDVASSQMKDSCFALYDVDQKDEKMLDTLSGKSFAKEFSFLKVGQSLMELGTIDKTFGKSLPQVLEDFGFLDKKVTIVGGNCFEKDDLMFLQNFDCNFVVCPTEDSKHGRRQTNLISLRSFDFDVGIGRGWNFEIDFFAFMRQILLSHWSMFEDNTCLCEKDVFQMAVGGIVKNRTGICEGQLADFIVVKNSASPYQDIFKNLVWGASKQDVLMTVSLGTVLQINGEILNISEYDQILKNIKDKFKERKNDD